MANPDNAEDFRLGVLCNDGEFEPRASNTWPDESRCVEVRAIDWVQCKPIIKLTCGQL